MMKTLLLSALYRLGLLKNHRLTAITKLSLGSIGYESALSRYPELEPTLDHYSVSLITVKEKNGVATVTIHTSRPGILIGRRGENLKRIEERVKAALKMEVHIRIVEVDAFRPTDLEIQVYRTIHHN